MKKILTLSMVILFAAQTLAAPSGKILIASADVDPQEYKGALIAFEKVISPSEWYLRITPQMNSVEKLLQLYARAEKAYLESQDLSLAKDLYQQVTLLENQDDWDGAQRKILLTSYLRLLQIESDPLHPNRKDWIQKALLYMEGTEVPSELIPPPILRELDLYSSTWPKQKWRFSQKMKTKYSQVLILGRKYPSLDSVTIPETKEALRVTFLSDFYAPVTKVLTAKESQNFQAAGKNYVSGTCAHWSANTEITGSMNFEIYQPRSCEVSKASEISEEKALAKFDQIPQSKTSWKMPDRKWLWIGLGVIATAVAISQVQGSQKKENPPTESYGF